MVVMAPAAPRTPTKATLIAERRCAEVGVAKLFPVAVVEFVPSEDGIVVCVEEDVKNEIGRAINTTPKREMREAYCADRGKGSCRKR